MKSNKTAVHVWVFDSSSGTKTYQTLKWSDGSLSCECPGWTRRCVHRLTPSGAVIDRTCKHVRMVAAGCADSYCVKHSNLTAMDTGPQVDTGLPYCVPYARKFG